MANGKLYNTNTLISISVFDITTVQNYFYSRTVHLDIITVFTPTDAQVFF